MRDFTDFFEADSFKKAYTSELSTLQCGFKMRESIAGIHGLEEADIVLLGCHPIKNESGLHVSNSIREALYQLYDWHPKLERKMIIYMMLLLITPRTGFPDREFFISIRLSTD